MSDTTLTPLLTAKQAAAKQACALVQEGMIIGLGTGSTAAFFIEALAKRCQEGLHCTAVATSHRSMLHAQHLGIHLINPDNLSCVDMTIDGADEIDPHKNMIKGGGGALLREKLMAQASHEMVVIIDETKLVEQLGDFPVPIEIAPFMYLSTLERLKNKNYEGILRLTRDQRPYLTDNGNYIFDIQYSSPITHPDQEHEQLKLITGVLETGLFFNVAKRVIVGYQDGLVKILN